MASGIRLACILAAGYGSRLKSRTRDDTKCMVDVGERPLISHLLEVLVLAGFDEVAIVVGHGAASLISYVNEHGPANLPVHYVENRDYASTNNIYSLYLALEQYRDRDYGEVAVFESDVFVAPATAQRYLTDPSAANSALVSPYEYWMEGTAVTITPDRRIENFVAKRDVGRYAYSELYKTVNWYRFSRHYVNEIYIPFLKAYLSAKGRSNYYEDVLRAISPHVNNDLVAHPIPTSEWIEIDDEEDLRRAEIIAGAGRNAALLAAQFGGYWKHSYITDLTLLENPGFPSPGLMLEMSRSLDQAVRGYSSRQSIIAAVAAKTLKVEAANLVVGNGASELLALLFAADAEPYAIAPPFFLEFERLLSDGRLNILDRAYPADPLSEAYRAWLERPDQNLIVVNPNNPTGEMLQRDLLLRLVTRAGEAGRRVLVDESFIDFSLRPSESLLAPEVLARCPNLVVIKSLGKSHGIAGIRLGLLASADDALLARLRHRLPIWNVSSIAEVYLDLLPKYLPDLQASMTALGQARTGLARHLGELGIWTAASFANFLLLPLRSGAADAIEQRFLAQGLLIKTLRNRRGLAGDWLRLPVKDAQTNARVADLLGECRALFRSAANIAPARE